jgi:hypothetical protein
MSAKPVMLLKIEHIEKAAYALQGISRILQDIDIDEPHDSYTVGGLISGVETLAIFIDSTICEIGTVI